MLGTARIFPVLQIGVRWMDIWTDILMHIQMDGQTYGRMEIQTGTPTYTYRDAVASKKQIRNVKEKNTKEHKRK